MSISRPSIAVLRALLPRSAAARLPAGRRMFASAGSGSGSGSGAEMQVGELEGGSFRIEPLRRRGEDVGTMRARLLCMFLFSFHHPTIPPFHYPSHSNAREERREERQERGERGERGEGWEKREKEGRLTNNRPEPKTRHAGVGSLIIDLRRRTSRQYG